MQLYKHADYNEYVKAQTDAFNLKHSRNWVTEMELAIIANHVILKYGIPEFTICHGARNGFEVGWLKKYFGYDARVVGTDIGKWSEEIEDMVQWDFHELNEVWTGNADMIYSNSLDHSFDPVKAIATWLQTLKPDGILVVHWSHAHEKGEPKASDCFIASWDEYNELLGAAGRFLEWCPIKILKGGGFFIVKKRKG